MLAAIAPIALVERPDDPFVVVVETEVEEATTIEELASKIGVEFGGIIVVGRDYAY